MSPGNGSSRDWVDIDNENASRGTSGHHGESRSRNKSTAEGSGPYDSLDILASSWTCKGCKTKNSGDRATCKTCRYSRSTRWAASIDCPFCGFGPIQIATFGGACINCFQSITTSSDLVYLTPFPVHMPRQSNLESPDTNFQDTNQSLPIPTLLRQRNKGKGLKREDTDDQDVLIHPSSSDDASPSSSGASSNVDWHPQTKASHLFGDRPTLDPSTSSDNGENDSPTPQGAVAGNATASNNPDRPPTSAQGGDGVSITTAGAALLFSASAGGAPPPPPPPPSGSSDAGPVPTGKPKPTWVARLWDFLCCSEAIMLYIQLIQATIVVLQTISTTLYFSSNPVRGTGTFGSEYMSLLSASLAQSITLAFSLKGIKKQHDDNLWIWTVTVASVSIFCIMAGLVMFFVYTAFGNLFMCMAVVCQLWIWKFVRFGTRREEGARRVVPAGRTDLEMQMR